MPLIIEGADNLGKTTAAKRLVELAPQVLSVPVRYGHMSRPPKGFDFCNDYRHWTTDLTVQDRFHLGALIWHENVVDLERWRRVEAELVLRGSLVVVMYAEPEWYEAHPKGENQFPDEKIIRANKTYRGWMTGSMKSGLTSASGIDQHEEEIVPHVDVFHRVDAKGFPSDEVLMHWLELWRRRLNLTVHHNCVRRMEALSERPETLQSVFAD